MTGNVLVTVEWLKDGPEGDTIASRLESLDVGMDDDGETITSCVVVPVDEQAVPAPADPKLTKNQQTMFSLLQTAGAAGLTTEEWNERAREAGIGIKRKADLYDFRASLKAKQIIRQYGDRWSVAS
jgi:hypothetical protein